MTPEQMRALAQRVNECDVLGVSGLLEDVETALRAAADQLEAVDGWLERQYRRGWQSVPDLDALGDILNPNPPTPGRSNAEHDEVVHLRAVIENAPHGPSCWLVDPQSTWTKNERDCTCWKADVLG